MTREASGEDYKTMTSKLKTNKAGTHQCGHKYLCAVVPNNRSSHNNPPLINSLEHFSVYFICTVMYSNKGNNTAYAAARGTNSVTELRQR